MDVKKLCPHTLRHVAVALRAAAKNKAVDARLNLDIIARQCEHDARVAELYIAPLRDVGNDTPTRRIERPR